jgi:hypothetical protein
MYPLPGYVFLALLLPLLLTGAGSFLFCAILCNRCTRREARDHCADKT